jgi:cyclase
VLSRRVLACLDLRDGRVVKGVRFRDHVDAGDPLTLARRYRDAGADELVVYDIAASPRGRPVEPARVARLARQLDIPFCVAGGISSVARARQLLAAGADKISVNSPALARPQLIDELAAVFGSQSVVVGIDSRRDRDGEWRVHAFTGDAATSRALPRRTLDWVVEAQERGAGEIVLNCMGHDGVGGGYDVEQLRAVRRLCTVPLIASGGAGAPEHFAAVFLAADVDGALAAGAFHRGEIGIAALKRHLRARGLEVRDVA